MSGSYLPMRNAACRLGPIPWSHRQFCPPTPERAVRMGVPAVAERGAFAGGLHILEPEGMAASVAFSEATTEKQINGEMV